MEDKKINFTLSDFNIGESIGSGNFTSLFKAEHKETKQTFALKQASKRVLQNKNKFGDLLMEKHCLQKLQNCESVVDFEATFQDPINIYLLMELLTGPELWEFIKFKGVIDKHMRKYLMRKIAESVKHIHDSGIVHRDLKPENMIFSKQMTQLKLIDFGTALDLENPNVQGSGNSTTGRKVFHNFVGTPNYMPPECLNDKQTGKYSDIFSLGNNNLQDVHFILYSPDSQFIKEEVNI